MFKKVLYNKIKVNRFSSKLSNKNEKIDNYYKFMEDNINKDNTNELITPIVDDLNVLKNVLKCPMTDSKLEVSEEGLRVQVIFF